MSKTAAIKAIGIILSGYPSAESFDREGYVKISVAALESYPDDVLALMADPRRGIIRQSMFIPAVAEMCAFLDAECDRRRRIAEQNERDRQRALPAPEKAVDPERRAYFADMLRKTTQEIRARNGDPMKRDHVSSSVELRQMAEVWLQREKMNPRPMPQISSGLARVLGLKL